MFLVAGSENGMGMLPLDKDRIAATALAIVDEAGPSALTIRAVANALQVTPMALYYHVENKRALVELLVTYALAHNPLPKLEGSWRNDIWLIADWMRSGIRAHPNLTRLRQTYRVWTPEMLRMSETWLGLWRESGLKADKAALAARTSLMAIWGVIDQEAAVREVEPPPEEHLARVPSARNLYDSQGHDADSIFNLAVHAIIDGLCLRLSGDG